MATVSRSFSMSLWAWVTAMMTVGILLIATASTEEKLDICKRAGADQLLNYKEVDFVSAVKEATEGRGADVIYDPVGGDVFDKSSKCINFGGRLLVIGFASGRIPEIAANRILLKNISIVGVHWQAYHQRDPDTIRDTHQRLLELHQSGKIKPILFGNFEMAELPDALSAIAERRSWGKIVVRNQK